MKTLVVLFASFLSLNAVAQAAPKQADIDAKALEILLKNSGQFSEYDVDKGAGPSVAQVLASQLVTGGKTSNEISNSCSFDKNDQVFKCALRISNSDKPARGRSTTESVTSIFYELEKSENGLPSEDVFMWSVRVDQAG